MRRLKLLLVPLILLAFFLRVWQLPQTPPGLWYDEAYYSMDAARLLDGGPWQIFFAGNNGREPIWIYWQALLIWIFGAAPLTSRLLAPFLGTLTVPLVYVLARRLTRRQPYSQAIALVAAATMTISFWHVGLSRGGYRGILLPLAAALTFYTFWRAWRQGSVRFMLLAGLALGLSQYTYLAARVLPLGLGAFALAWSGLHWPARPVLKRLWLTLLVMAGVSALVFAPLGWVFYQDPTLFSARTGDVLFRPASVGDLATHLWTAVRLFIDGGDPNWRHHLPGRPMLGWLGWLGFWPGLVICLRRLRHSPCSASLFLVVMLVSLYLPAWLAEPPVHALRLSAMLPLYAVIFALGLVGLGGWLVSRRGAALTYPVAGAIILILLLETGLTGYDYFYRWAEAEETYVEYNGPLVDLVNEVLARSQSGPVVIPFELYVHPTTRYLLHDHFVEQAPPASLAGPVQLVTMPNNFQVLNVANIPDLPSLVWLSQTAEGEGSVYVSRPPRSDEAVVLDQLAVRVTPESYRDRFGHEVAQFRTLTDPIPLLPLFLDRAPQRTVRLNWGNQAELVGYEISPLVVQPGRPLNLNLYWRSLTEKTFDHKLFLQVIDTAGNPINQWEGDAFREDMYRWRPNAILPTQHTLWLGPETPPGTYLIRLGFFDRHSGERLPVWPEEGKAGGLENEDTPPVDQIQLGLFYVAGDSNPLQPTTPLTATFGEAIQLIGITLPNLPTFQPSNLPITFHWTALQPTDRPYTVFLQLLNDQGQVITSWDSQPFNGLYPTSLWSPGEPIADTFVLPLPETGLSPGYYRLITGFYDITTGQRLPVDAGGDFVELTVFGVEETY